MKPKYHYLLIINCILIITPLYGQVPQDICYYIFDKAITHAKDKADAQDKILNQLANALSPKNPVESAQQSWDKMLGKAQKELPGQGNWKLVFEVFEAAGAKYCFIQPAFQRRCGCNATGYDPAYAAPNSNSIASSPNRFRSIFSGDSHVMVPASGPPSYHGWTTYTGGFPIKNIGVGMSTSSDHFDWLNNCAAQSIYGHTDRTQQNINPNPDKETGSVIFKNKRVFVRMGGNDFNSYTVVLQTLPILIPFRHGNTINNHNRYITYVQAQRGANVTILGPIPLPAMNPYEINKYGLIGDALFRALWLNLNFDMNSPSGLPQTPTNPGEKGTVIDEQGNIQGDIGTLLNPVIGFLNNWTGVAEIPMILHSQLQNAIFSKEFFPSIQGDHTWTSQRLWEQNLFLPVFTANRQVDYISSWHTFMNWSHPEFYWMANPYFFTFDGGPINLDYMTEKYKGDLRSYLHTNDSIHPNALGYAVWGANLAPYMKSQELDLNTMPLSEYDGCNYEPDNSAPDASDFSFKPNYVAPPIASTEPPMLPEVNDGDLWLIALCLFTGACW